MRRALGSAEDRCHGGTYYTPVAAHGMFAPLGTMASAHFCASIPNLMLQEWRRSFLDSLNRIAPKPT